MSAGARAVAAAGAMAMAACGGARTRGGGGGGPAVDAGAHAAVDAVAPDPATVELLAALAVQRDRACACTDRACAEDAEALAVQWGLDHPDVVSAARPGVAEQATAHALIEAAEACIERWLEHP